MGIIIKNGRIIDGLGEPVPYTPWVKADVKIEEDKIDRIGDLSLEKTK